MVNARSSVKKCRGREATFCLTVLGEEGSQYYEECTLHSRVHSHFALQVLSAGEEDVGM